MKLLVITPVKDSLNTTTKTIHSIHQSEGAFNYLVFDDFSDQETADYLDNHAASLGYQVIHLKDHINTPSPNYRTTLIMAQKQALEEKVDLIIVESDVMVTPETLTGLSALARSLDRPGMVGSVTTDEQGTINFPYLHIKKDDPEVILTQRSLSFCCTLITYDFLERFDFNQLANEKDWYDVAISKKSRSLGFKNYVIKRLPVLHQPHSSRPWKHEKYSNPIKYYLKKIFFKRDRI